MLYQRAVIKKFKKIVCCIVAHSHYFLAGIRNPAADGIRSMSPFCALMPLMTSVPSAGYQDVLLLPGVTGPRMAPVIIWSFHGKARVCCRCNDSCCLITMMMCRRFGGLYEAVLGYPRRGRSAFVFIVTATSKCRRWPWCSYSGASLLIMTSHRQRNRVRLTPVYLDVVHVVVLVSCRRSSCIRNVYQLKYLKMIGFWGELVWGVLSSYAVRLHPELIVTLDGESRSIRWPVTLMPRLFMVVTPNGLTPWEYSEMVCLFLSEGFRF